MYVCRMYYRCTYCVHSTCVLGSFFCRIGSGYGLLPPAEKYKVCRYSVLPPCLSLPEQLRLCQPLTSSAKIHCLPSNFQPLSPSLYSLGLSQIPSRSRPERHRFQRPPDPSGKPASSKKINGSIGLTLAHLYRTPRSACLRLVRVNPRRPSSWRRQPRGCRQPRSPAASRGTLPRIISAG